LYHQLTGAPPVAYNAMMHSRTPPRNRLAKVLPEEWRKLLVARGAPKRKYTAVCRATLAGGRVIEEMIVEEGWIIALDRDGLAGNFEQRINFDPRLITDVEVIQIV
jgi:hypothetical protein